MTVVSARAVKRDCTMRLIANRKREEGASAVEFAIILPVLLLLLCGIIDFGVLFYDKQLIANASRVGARAGIARTSATISSIVTSYCTTNSPGDRLITFSDVRTPVTTVSDMRISSSTKACTRSSTPS